MRFLLAVVTVVLSAAPSSVPSDKSIAASLKAAGYSRAEASFLATREFVAQFKAAPTKVPAHPPKFEAQFLSEKDVAWLTSTFKAILSPRIPELSADDETAIRENLQRLDAKTLDEFVATRNLVRAVLKDPKTAVAPPEFQGNFILEGKPEYDAVMEWQIDGMAREMSKKMAPQ